MQAELTDEGDAFWASVKEQTHSAFESSKSLWRVRVPPATPPLELPGLCAMEGNGALRWYTSDMQASAIRRVVSQVNGYACLFRGTGIAQIFNPLPPAVLQVHQRLKHAFDPHGILNPGKLYPEF